MIFTIAAREVRGLFLSPLAWSILAVVTGILGFLFLSQVERFLVLQGQLAALENAPGVTLFAMSAVFGSVPIVLLIVVPLITMRSISEERRAQTLPLLFSAPLSMTEIILGKYLGVMAFLLIMLGLIVLMPLSLLMGGALDFGMLLSGLLGLALLMGSFAAAGLYMSTLTAQPIVAAISTFGLLLLLWIVDWAGRGGEAANNALSYLSILRHYEPLLQGVFNSADVVYYVLFISAFLVLSIRRLDADRLQH